MLICGDCLPCLSTCLFLSLSSVCSGEFFLILLFVRLSLTHFSHTHTPREKYYGRKIRFVGTFVNVAIIQRRERGKKISPTTTPDARGVDVLAVRAGVAVDILAVVGVTRKPRVFRKVGRRAAEKKKKDILSDV